MGALQRIEGMASIHGVSLAAGQAYKLAAASRLATIGALDDTALVHPYLEALKAQDSEAM